MHILGRVSDLRDGHTVEIRDDVIIVASVSAIYGLGDPVEYRQLMVTLAVGTERSRDGILEELVQIQYRRNDAAFERGTFRVGPVVWRAEIVFPAQRGRIFHFLL